ncbi:MAG: hypothetical protein ACAI38_02305 [Myxococcota bacterium]
MRHFKLPTLFLAVTLVATGCATTTRETPRGAKLKQYEQTSAAVERAHRVRAWRSADAFALGGD